MESILTSVKKLIGITEEDTIFDVDLIIYINSILSVLTQVGVGPSEGFSIEDSSATWEEFTENNLSIEMVKTYIVLNAKLVFDPPVNSSVLEAYNQRIKELEWRLNIASDTE